MNSKSNNFKIAFIFLVFFEIISTYLALDGVSVAKMILTSLVWGTLILSVVTYFKKSKEIKNDIPNFAFQLLNVILLWNIICILRSLLLGDGSVVTLFGHVFTGLSLLIPFSFSFYSQFDNVKFINSFFIKMIKVGFVMFLGFYALSGGNFSDIQIKILFILITPITFLITVLPFQSKKVKNLIFIGVLLLLYLAFLWKARTMMIRIPLLLAGLLVIGLYKTVFFKLILKYSFLLLLLPFYFLQSSYESGNSFFDRDLSTVSADQEMTADSRTFLYQELYADLVKNDQLLMGKGANGTYYSNYFDLMGHDSKSRLTLEVGLLALLLKGGLVSVGLNLVLLFIAVYFAFFKSKNTFVIGIGYILLVHLILLFVENLVGFNIYNFVIWVFIGVCLSKEIRGMTNAEIKQRINIDKKKWKYNL